MCVGQPDLRVSGICIGSAAENAGRRRKAVTANGTETMKEEDKRWKEVAEPVPAN
jgi:hypothetical protein